MEIMELAAELGKMIKADTRALRFEAADNAFDTDAGLQSMMEEYRTQRAALEEECKKETPDKSFTEIIEGRIEDLYRSITENSVYVEYSEAREALDDLMHEVNGEITFQLTGQRPCSHDDCESCGGGCQH